MKDIVRLFLCGGLLLLTGSIESLYASANVPGQDACVEVPGFGYTETVSALVDGDELQIRVSDRFGGAVESLTWRGVEFINIWDHGRQISYAWSMNNYGECLNPTEPGSGRDYQAPTSTSELLRVCKPAENSLTTTTRPAFWLAPGESGFCSGGVTMAVNDDVVSDQILEKTIQIGYEGVDNVIVFDAKITNPADYDFMRIEIPTGYLTSEFSSYYLFNPQSGELTVPESQPLAPPWSFLHYGPLPPILATADGRFAMGAYYPGPNPRTGYGIFRADSANPAEETNKWHITAEEEPYPAGVYEYRSFAIVGTLETVQEAMSALYALHPVDFNLPMGYVDVANCTEIAGWAWDVDRPDEPIEVALYEVDEAGEERLIVRTVADIFRPDLVSALGDNGEHGFRIETPDALRDGESHTIRVDGLNPDEGLPAATLLPATNRLICEAVARPTETPPPAPTVEPTVVAAAAETDTPSLTPTVELADAASTETTESGSPSATAAPEAAANQPFCGLALLVVGAVVFFARPDRGKVRDKREKRL